MDELFCKCGHNCSVVWIEVSYNIQQSHQKKSQQAAKLKS
jgi:hypothetical protein